MRSSVGVAVEVDEHASGGVVLISVADRVDHRLADGDAHPVDGVVVEPGVPPDLIADHLDEVHAFRTRW